MGAYIEIDNVKINNYTFPATDAGSGNFVISTDGSGNLSFTSIAGLISTFRETETLTSSKTNFTVTSGYVVGNLDVYYNGFRLLNGDDYIATNGNSFTLSEPAASGDVIEWIGIRYPQTHVSLLGVDSGRLLFSDGTTNHAVGSTGLYYKSNMLGINTTTPTTTLDVAGSGRFAALNINNSYTFPTTDGLANYFLKTDGSGNLLWSNVSFDGESDPTVASHIKNITQLNITNWHEAYAWGNHSGLYLTEHPPIIAANSTNNSNSSYIQNILVDANGHITGISTSSVNVGSSNNFPTGLTFNTANGILTLGISGLPSLTVDLDGRYSTIDRYVSGGTFNASNGTITLSRASSTSVSITGLSTVRSNVPAIAGASGISNIVQMTQAAYDALGSYDPTTVYFII